VSEGRIGTALFEFDFFDAAAGDEARREEDRFLPLFIS
jgi:hypothetical protein